MNIHVFSILLLVFIFKDVIRIRDNKIRLINLAVLTATIEIFIEVGNFIEIKEILISYSTIMEVLILGYSIIVLIKEKRVKSKTMILAALIFGVVSLGICGLILNPENIMGATSEITWDDIMRGESLQKIQFNTYVIKQAIQLFIFIIVIMTIYSFFDKEDYKEVLKKFTKNVKIMLVFGLIEFIIKYIFNSNVFNNFCEIIFGTTTQAYTEITSRGSGYVLQGFTKEASHYAYVLMISIISLYAMNKMTGKEKKWIILAIILMIASMSFSCYWFLGGILLIYIIQWTKKSDNVGRIIKWTLLIIGLILIIHSILANISTIYNKLEATGFIQRRIKSLIEEIELITSGRWLYNQNSLEWSNRVRLGSSYETIKLLKYKPLFGVGISAATSHGSTTMLLSGIGIIGTYLWTKLSFYASNLSIQNKKYYTLGVIVFLIINLLNSMWLRPFYELSVLIWMISLNIIFSNYDKQDKEKREKIEL